MVFRKLLASLGLGGVEADTVLTPEPAVAGGALTGQVNLRVKSDTAITAITLILVVRGQSGDVELSRYPVAGSLNLAGGSTHSVPFSVPVPGYAPFTVLYGQPLPGFSIGVRTELTVASGSAKGDFDPVHIDASPVHRHIMDALGTIGARFVRHEVRPGATAGLPAPQAQVVTFSAPAPEGQPVGPYIPQVSFLLAGTGAGMTVVAEPTARPGSGDKYDLSHADIERLSTEEAGWINEVDRWLVQALDKLNQPATVTSGAFLQQQPGVQQPAGQPGYGQPGSGYAYAERGNQGYQYGGYRGRPSMAGGLMAGVAGGALGFLGGMMIADMLTPDMPADVGAMEDPAWRTRAWRTQAWPTRALTTWVAVSASSDECACCLSWQREVECGRLVGMVTTVDADRVERGVHRPVGDRRRVGYVVGVDPLGPGRLGPAGDERDVAGARRHRRLVEHDARLVGGARPDHGHRRAGAHAEAKAAQGGRDQVAAVAGPDLPVVVGERAGDAVLHLGATDVDGGEPLRQRRETRLPARDDAHEGTVGEHDQVDLVHRAIVPVHPSIGTIWTTMLRSYPRLSTRSRASWIFGSDRVLAGNAYRSTQTEIASGWMSGFQVWPGTSRNSARASTYRMPIVPIEPGFCR
jgi:sporulation-control protein